PVYPAGAPRSGRSRAVRGRRRSRVTPPPRRGRPARCAPGRPGPTDRSRIPRTRSPGRRGGACRGGGRRSYGLDRTCGAQERGPPPTGTVEGGAQRHGSTCSPRCRPGAPPPRGDGCAPKDDAVPGRALNGVRLDCSNVNGCRTCCVLTGVRVVVDSAPVGRTRRIAARLHRGDTVRRLSLAGRRLLPAPEPGTVWTGLQ